MQFRRLRFDRQVSRSPQLQKLPMAYTIPVGYGNRAVSQQFGQQPVPLLQLIQGGLRRGTTRSPYANDSLDVGDQLRFWYRDQAGLDHNVGGYQLIAIDDNTGQWLRPEYQHYRETGQIWRDETGKPSPALMGWSKLEGWNPEALFRQPVLEPPYVPSVSKDLVQQITAPTAKQLIFRPTELPDATRFNRYREAPHFFQLDDQNQIVAMPPTGVFVFGSNTEGRHGAGAALTARNQFGAQPGQATGLMGLSPDGSLNRQQPATGLSYGVRTKDLSQGRLPLAVTQQDVDQLIDTAIAYPELAFAVTPIGTGLARGTAKEYAPMFRKAPNNLWLPDAFVDVLEGKDAIRLPAGTQLESASPPTNATARLAGTMTPTQATETTMGTSGWIRNWFSNMAPVAGGITYDGLTYPSVENFYQAMKVDKNHPDKQQLRLPFTQMSSYEAKRAGRQLPLRADWQDINLQIMEYGLRQKFKPGTPEYDQLLQATDLHEYNNWGDQFWGVLADLGPDGQVIPRRDAQGNLIGQDNLGKLLTKIRDEALTTMGASPPTSTMPPRLAGTSSDTVQVFATPRSEPTATTPTWRDPLDLSVPTEYGALYEAVRQGFDSKLPFYRTMAGTGHRPHKIGSGYENWRTNQRTLTRLADAALRVHRPERVISGMADGWDVALANAALDYKGSQDNKLQVVAAMPGRWFFNNLPPGARAYREGLLQQMDDVVYVDEQPKYSLDNRPGYDPRKLDLRNQWMSDHADAMLAYWDGSTGGTRNNIEYAQSIGQPVYNYYRFTPAMQLL